MVFLFIHSIEIMAQSAMVVSKGQKKEEKVSVGFLALQAHISNISTNSSAPFAARVVSNVENKFFVEPCKITSSRK